MEENRELVLEITGMDCATCARTVETGVARLPGVEESRLSFATAKLRVRGDVDGETVITRVRELGYDVSTNANQSQTRPGDVAGSSRSFLTYVLSQRNTLLALVGALLILPGLLFNELLPMLSVQSPVFDVMSVGAMLAAGLPIARSAYHALRINRDININVLMTIASVGAVFIGAYTEAGLVMVLFAIGEALEGFTATRARDAIRKLMAVVPNEATILRPCMDCVGHLGQDGYEGGPCPFCGLEEQRVPVNDINVGEVILVRPGERIAMDGAIIDGDTSINEAPITGESLPVAKGPDDRVFASTINGEGALRVSVTSRAEDNTISRLIHLVEEAQEARAPAQKLVDRFARVYTPAVVVLALLVAVIPPLLFDQPFLSTAETRGWLYRALALLVVACPCALVISTPVSLVSAISNAAQHGVLVKGGVFLEALSRIQAMAFDKTGTLTQGEPAVRDVRTAQCATHNGAPCGACDEMMALAGAVERLSEHPLGRAIVDDAMERGVQERYAHAQAVQALPGQGIVGYVDGREVVVGSHRYFDQHLAHEPHSCAEIESQAKAGHTSLLVGVDDHYLGYITVSDMVRPASRQTIEQLRKQGLAHLIMLTGDDRETAETVGREIGMSDVRANLLPQEKMSAIKALVAQFGEVAMVGDGINDAPALATARVGIAMGAAGTGQALETADIALMADDLTRLPFVLSLSRATMRTIRTNIAISLAIKFVFLVLVLIGVGTLWMAVLADMGASLLVTLNGARLLRQPQPSLGNPDLSDGGANQN